MQRDICNSEFSNRLPVAGGVPQSSVFGPFMLTVYINDLPNEFSTKCKMYAGYLKLIIIIRSFSDLRLKTIGYRKNSKQINDIVKTIANEI